MTEKDGQLEFWLEHDASTTTTLRNPDGTAKKKPRRENQHYVGPHATQIQVSPDVLKDKEVRPIVNDD